jgi:hypothetical protein
VQEKPWDASPDRWPDRTVSFPARPPTAGVPWRRCQMPHRVDPPSLDGCGGSGDRPDGRAAPARPFWPRRVQPMAARDAAGTHRSDWDLAPDPHWTDGPPGVVWHRPGRSGSPRCCSAPNRGQPLAAEDLWCGAWVNVTDHALHALVCARCATTEPVRPLRHLLGHRVQPGEVVMVGSSRSTSRSPRASWSRVRRRSACRPAPSPSTCATTRASTVVCYGDGMRIMSTSDGGAVRPRPRRSSP